jgi:Icc-related predicted phosphoesterase
MEKSSKRNSESKLKILAAGDLHGSSEIAEKLAEKAKKNNVDLVVLLGDIHGALKESKGLIAPFKKNHQKVVFVPGNWDSSIEANALSETYGIKNIDGYYVSYNNVGIVGLGNPDFQLSLNETKTFMKLKKNFDKIKEKDFRKNILISHLHAAGTAAEFSGFKGSKGLRKAVEYFEPDFLLQAHIHEAEGIEEKIGKTRVISVGRKGKIIEI